MDEDFNHITITYILKLILKLQTPLNKTARCEGIKNFLKKQKTKEDKKRLFQKIAFIRLLTYYKKESQNISS